MKAVFLDRDGVITVDKSYQYQTHDLELIPGAAAAIKKLKAGGYLAIIITNQSGVARGYFTEDDLLAFNSHMLKVLENEGAKADAVYYCPHLKGAKIAYYRKDCACRKPKPGMLIKAAKEYGVDLSRSWVVGDKASDVDAGKAAGCRTILIGKEKGKADALAKDLSEAVEYILR